jgi:hypothetical protein
MHNQLPPLTDDLRHAALAKALESRRARTSLLREVTEQGADGLAGVLERADEGDQVAAGLRVARLLRALPGIGTVRAGDLMKRLDIAENRRVRGLGPRQRAGLMEAVRR